MRLSREAGHFHSLSPQWSHAGPVVRQLSSPWMLSFSIFVSAPGSGIRNFMSSEIVGLVQVSAHSLKEKKKERKKKVALCLALKTLFSPYIKKKSRILLIWN